MTATNKCYNFVGFGYRAPLTNEWFTVKKNYTTKLQLRALATHRQIDFGARRSRCLGMTFATNYFRVTLACLHVSSKTKCL